MAFKMKGFSAFNSNGSDPFGSSKEEEPIIQPWWKQNKLAMDKKHAEDQAKLKEFIEGGGLDMMAAAFGHSGGGTTPPPTPSPEELTREFSMSKFEGHKGQKPTDVDPTAGLAEPSLEYRFEEGYVPPPGHADREAYYKFKNWAPDETVPGYEELESGAAATPGLGGGVLPDTPELGKTLTPGGQGGSEKMTRIRNLENLKSKNMRLIETAPKGKDKEVERLKESIKKIDEMLKQLKG